MTLDQMIEELDDHMYGLEDATVAAIIAALRAGQAMYEAPDIGTFAEAAKAWNAATAKGEEK
jgi:hypothetical protein